MKEHIEDTNNKVKKPFNGDQLNNIISNLNEITSDIEGNENNRCTKFLEITSDITTLSDLLKFRIIKARLNIIIVNNEDFH
jgi:hypothetical protein